MRWRPRLAGVLFAVNLLMVLLPLAGISILRLYETVLLRHTESELNMQGAFVVSIYRTELMRHFSNDKSSNADLSSYGNPISPELTVPANPDEPWRPVGASLDFVKDKIYPPPLEAYQSADKPDDPAQSVGDRLTPVLMHAYKMTLTGIKVMDHKGVVVASTRSDLGKSLNGQEEVRRALRGEHVSLLRQRMAEGPPPPLDSISRGSGVRIFVAMPVIEGQRVLGAALLSRTPEDLSKALYRNRYYLLSAGMVILVVMCVVTTLTTLLITRPIKTLIRQAQQVGKGEKNSVVVPLPKPGTREVALLSQALSEMSMTLERRGDYIRVFASNVSHEFKTPLTSLKGTVELLRDHFEEMSAEDRSRFLDILEKDADRLTLLVRKLLDLAKAEVIQPGTELVHVPDVFQRLSDRSYRDGLTVTFGSAKEIPSLCMAPEVFESILSGLIDNAGHHGGPVVNVKITAQHIKDSGKDVVEIVIQDDGRGVSPSDSDRIFRPFFTTARVSGRTGLGLSIVRALLVAHHGTITPEKSESGARFRILLPITPLGSELS